MVIKDTEIREDILKLNPMTSLYWDQNLRIWIFILAEAQEIHLPDHRFEVTKDGKLPEAEDFPKLPGLRKLVFCGDIIAYVISGKNL